MNLPKKELGQHWLRDKSILQAIVDAGEIQPQDKILEIGPGEGTLTQVLAGTGASVVALEFDSDLIDKLKEKFKNCDNVAIIYGDVRKFDFNTLDRSYKVIANIPYYLTSHLIRILSESNNPPSIAVLLVQKEVAERICAKPGEMSILSITAQYYFDCSLDIVVPAEYFEPPPKVDSQVVKLVKRRKELFDVDEKLFFRLVKSGFSEKRKTLRNSLSGGLAISKDESEKLLRLSGIDAGKRAQELSLDDWYSIYKTYISPTNNFS